MSRRIAADDLLAVADRIRWVHLCRMLMLVTLPVLGALTSVPAPVLRQLVAVSAGWLIVALASLGLARAGRRIAVLALTLTLLGDGVVLATGWHWLGDSGGPSGMLIILYAMSITLVATFRTGIKMVLWQSLLLVLVDDAQAVGLLAPQRAFPVRDLVFFLGWLWTATLATATLAAVNERELRRRRYDQQVLRELALALSSDQDPADVGATLARFAVAELSGRRAAVVMLSSPLFADQLGPVGIATSVDARGDARLVHLPGAVRRPELVADEVVLRHQLDEVDDAWLLAALPGGRDVIICPFAVLQMTGALVIECPRRWPRHFSRRVEHRLIVTARQATAQSAAAIGRAVATAKLAEIANTDGLTGLATRRRFDAALTERVAGDQPFSVVLVDLDHFKAVNDTHGHQAGDAVLRGVADALRRNCAPGDLVARYGGEELVVLSAGGPLEAATLAEALRQAVMGADTPVPITASLGAASWPTDATAEGALVEMADQRLYLAKRSGRNRAITSTEQALTVPELS
jgi:two-component system, cell cycle response regulator